MADYYPLLAKALANLPTRAAPTARRAIYERARKALIGQLRSIRPPVPESDIAVEEDAALDQAIARLEAGIWRAIGGGARVDRRAQLPPASEASAVASERVAANCCRAASFPTPRPPRRRRRRDPSRRAVCPLPARRRRSILSRGKSDDRAASDAAGVATDDGSSLSAAPRRRAPRVAARPDRS